MSPRRAKQIAEAYRDVPSLRFSIAVAVVLACLAGVATFAPHKNVSNVRGTAANPDVPTAAMYGEFDVLGNAVAPLHSSLEITPASSQQALPNRSLKPNSAALSIQLPVINDTEQEHLGPFWERQVV